MITQIDFAILDFIQILRTNFLDLFFSLYTHIGDGGILWILIALVCLCFRKTRKTGVTMALAFILGALVANVTLKPLIARLRPFQLRNVQMLIALPKDFSFPSGHTVSSFASAFAIFKGNKKWGSVALAVATLIAFSRLYLYVHFPSDVIAGVAIGLLCGWLADKIVKNKAVE